MTAASLKRKKPTTSRVELAAAAPRVEVTTPPADMQPVADAINTLAAQLQQALAAIAQLADYNRVTAAHMAQLAGRDIPAPVINLPEAKAPAVKTAAARGWDVVLIRDPETYELLGFEMRPKQ